MWGFTEDVAGSFETAIGVDQQADYLGPQRAEGEQSEAQKRTGSAFGDAGSP
jgi:hypothetical protein